ncbi:hypothetical protein [Streptomyces griseus]|uniref:hypothetical protein n=1 Tax=Streptomyces griseus TaxID=1911 RepID=UPI000B1F4622|nr:hypothetical protein [Streptomyces griseus]
MRIPDAVGLPQGSRDVSLVLDPRGGRVLRGGVLAGDATAYRTLLALTGREPTAPPDRLLSAPGPRRAAAPAPRGGRGLT